MEIVKIMKFHKWFKTSDNC